MFFNEHSSLEKVTEGGGLDGGDLGFSSRLKEVSSLGEEGGPLKVDLDSGLGSVGLGLLVGDNAGENLLLAHALPNMLDPDMDPLLDDAAVHGLVDTNSDGSLGEVENNSGPSVVVLVGHTLVDRRVGENVNVVTDLDVHQVLRQVGKSVLPELLGEHVARTRALSERVRHILF